MGDYRRRTRPHLSPPRRPRPVLPAPFAALLNALSQNGYKFQYDPLPRKMRQLLSRFTQVHASHLAARRQPPAALCCVHVRALAALLCMV